VTVTVSALVSGLDAELRRLGYKYPTLVWYRRCWRRLEGFFAARGVEEFSLNVAMTWVDEACGFFEKERSGTLEPNDIYLFRVAQMLGDYALHGAVLRRYNRSIDKLSGDDAEMVVRFQAWLGAAGRAVSTVRTYGTVAGEFVAFIGTRGGLGCCDAAGIEAFVVTLAGYPRFPHRLRVSLPRSRARGAGCREVRGSAAVPGSAGRGQGRWRCNRL
jgi:hypothetical protein